MKCTRCKKELIEGDNVRKDWHVPICQECRKEMVENGKWGTSKLTEEERKIMNERLKKII